MFSTWESWSSDLFEEYTLRRLRISSVSYPAKQKGIIEKIMTRPSLIMATSAIHPILFDRMKWPLQLLCDLCVFPFRFWSINHERSWPCDGRGLFNWFTSRDCGWFNCLFMQGFVLLLHIINDVIQQNCKRDEDWGDGIGWVVLAECTEGCN